METGYGDVPQFKSGTSGEPGDYSHATTVYTKNGKLKGGGNSRQLNASRSLKRNFPRSISTKGKTFKELATEVVQSAVEALEQEHERLVIQHEREAMQRIAVSTNTRGAHQEPSVRCGQPEVLWKNEEVDVCVVAIDDDDEIWQTEGWVTSGDNFYSKRSRRNPSEKHSMSERDDSHKERKKFAMTKAAYALLPEWNEELDDHSQSDLESEKIARLQYRAGLKKMLNNQIINSKAISTGMDPTSCISATCMMNPTSNARFFWDIVGALCLAFEALIIPMAVFDMGDAEDGYLTSARRALLVYWTADIIGSFLVGYVKANGDLEMRFCHVAKKYMRGWFPLDVVIVGMDWVTVGSEWITGKSLLAAGHSGIARLSKVGRLLRVLRILRLARLAKLRRIATKLQDGIGLEHTAIMFSLLKNMLRIWLVTHYIACVWFWIGERSDHSWLSSRQSTSWWYNYLMCMHWSIANFTPGSSGIQPQTAEELLFSVCILFFAMVVFSVFVSSTTSLINRLVGIKSTRDKQMFTLKAFLTQENFDVGLRERILRYVRAAMGGRRTHIKRDEVELLNVLSEHLREEVQMNLHMGTIGKHPLFQFLGFAGPQLVRKLSVEALFEEVCSGGDIIFSIGEEIDKMGFLESGVLLYSCLKIPDADVLPDSLDDAVGTGVDWDLQLLSTDAAIDMQTFCEAPLWTHWSTKGTMRADTDCTILEIDGVEFRKCVKRHPHMMSVLIRYAHAFVQTLNQARLEACGLTGSSSITDLQGPLIYTEPIQSLFSAPWMVKSSGPSVASSPKHTSGANHIAAMWDSIKSTDTPTAPDRMNPAAANASPLKTHKTPSKESYHSR